MKCRSALNRNLLSEQLHGVLRHSNSCACTLVVLWLFFVGQEHLDSWKALHAILSAKLLVLIGVDLCDFDGRMYSLGHLLPLGKDRLRRAGICFTRLFCATMFVWER
jgi:hypothetical protein